MEPIDLLALNKTSNSYSTRNVFLGRPVTLPRCVKRWTIRGGPSLPRICAAAAEKFPTEMSRKYGFKHADERISERVPLEFSIDSETSHRYTHNFSIEAVIWSVDVYPDPHALAWSIYGCRQPKHIIAELANCIALRGSFRSISDSEWTPESLKGGDYQECIIAYDPRRSHVCGWLGEVAPVQELPTCGLIKDFDVLAQIVSKFVGGFMEEHLPDGTVHWGRLSGGGTGSWISCDAIRDPVQQWKYAGSKDGWSLNLNGVRYVHKENTHWHELVGDAFLCSDGTVLHSYYFSRKEWGEESNVPKEWKDGYYHNRIYPPGSLMIPEYVTASFEREMPAWFYKEDEARKAKMQKSVR
ncbi:MAG: hypothetical protein Q7S52_00010 [bacterium]|nr:hypothetical protein [bacterium]